jgi:hypothetical protein
MKLYALKFSRKKLGKQELLMIDSLHKCEQYKKARESGGNESKAAKGFHVIEEAPVDSKIWRIKSSTVGGNKYQVGKNNGYISKSGFNPHT